MFKFISSSLYAFAISVFVSGETTIYREELCIKDVFKSKCSQSDMLFIKNAKYGRIKIGKCLSEKELEIFGANKNDPKNVGCYDDITDMTNQKCNFKSSCEIKPFDLQTDEHLSESKSCFPGLIKYLEMEYVCFSVLEHMDDCSRVHVQSRPIHLNPSTISEACNSIGHALQIEAPKGQKIRVEMVNLNQNPTEDASRFHERSSCGLIIATLRDAAGKQNASACQKGFLVSNLDKVSSDFRPSFLSKGHLLEILIHPLDTASTYLLRLTADGCLDIIPPEDTWLKRNNDDIVIGCYSSKQTWYLRCENGKWVGTIGNCSQHSHFQDATSLQENVEKIRDDKIYIPESQQILVIIAICGFGVVVCLVIVCTGAVCLNRYKKKENTFNHAYDNFKPENPMQYSDNASRTIFISKIKPSVNRADTDHATASDLQFGHNKHFAGDERYQVLDKEEVAKETFLTASC